MITSPATKVMATRKRLAPLLFICLALGSLFAFVAVLPPSSWLQPASVVGGLRTRDGFPRSSHQLFGTEPQRQGVVEARRNLFTAGVPGEGLLLAEVEDDASSPAADGSSGEDIGNDGHKPLFPLDRSDIVTALLATLGLMIAAAGGIGGGGMLVPLFVLCAGFSAKLAVPLSNITILGGAITNACLNLRKRHPLADRPLVDWDLILVMEPLTIGGALAGSFIQKVLPEFLLTVTMILLLVATSDRTIRKGIKNFKKESAERMKQKALADANGVPRAAAVKTVAIADASVNDAGSLLGGSSKVTSSYGTSEAMSTTEVAPVTDANLATANDEENARMLSSTMPNPLATDEEETTLKRILAQERTTSVTKIAVMCAVFAVIMTINMLKGGGGFESPLGIVCGSPGFWLSTVLSFVWVLAVSFRVRHYLVKQWRLKDRVHYKYVEGDVEWTPVNTIRYPAICFFAGFFAGMFGVGGGIVKGPLMLEMGVHPMVAASTSAVMILFTSFTATTSFLVFGLLRMDYAVPLFFIGLVATALGQWGTEYFIRKFKRPSFIILSIGSVVALSAFLMGVNGLLAYFSGSANATEGGGICSAGL